MPVCFLFMGTKTDKKILVQYFLKKFFCIFAV